MFFLLIAKIIPPTSIVVPLISKYLLFTFIMNILSVLNTCIVINLYYKRLSLDQLHPCLRFVFFRIMPRLLFLNRNKQATAAATRERIASLSLSASSSGCNQHLESHPNASKPKLFKSKKTKPPPAGDSKKKSGRSSNVRTCAATSSRGDGGGVDDCDVFSSAPTSPIAIGSTSKRTVNEMFHEIPFVIKPATTTTTTTKTTTKKPTNKSQTTRPKANRAKLEMIEMEDKQKKLEFKQNFDSNNDILLVSSGSRHAQSSSNSDKFR